MISMTLLLTLSGLIWQGQAVKPDIVRVAERFLPPNAELAEDYSFDYRRGQVSRRWPAVLAAHVLGAESQDIVFAYYSPRVDTIGKTLFVSLLHFDGKDYEQVYEVSYRSQVLFGPEGLRLLRLSDVHGDALAVMAGIGAALGGHLDVLVWRDPWGWENVFPPNGSQEYFYSLGHDGEMRIALSAAHHPGADNTPAPEPPPAWFRWDGKAFVKTQ